MTIIEAIKTVLKDNPSGLTAYQIYEEIVKRDLYAFKAKIPDHVVNTGLRRRCAGLDFPTSHPIKLFKIVGDDGKKIKYALLESKEKAVSNEESSTKKFVESLPEEKLIKAFQEHIDQTKQEVLDMILNQSPSFFEQLVVDLLLKMGYGYDKNSGVVTGGSHDNGIDGIISEDKLGLDLIYIQAKRFSANNKVGRKDLQAFIGAMGNIQKGVFITTSTYTKEASAFGKQQQQKNIKLIDGDMLAEYMIKYQIGVECVKTFDIYKIDSDYFQ